MAKYQIIVGNLGMVVDTQIYSYAISSFNDYRAMSQSGKGRVGGESVTLIVNGEPDPRHTHYLERETDGA